jgi:glycine cleavage system H protein
MPTRYSQDHLYILVEDGVGTVGITKYAQEELVEVTVVELPHIGAQVHGKTYVQAIGEQD